MSNQLDDPVIRRRTVRNLLVLTPFLFLGCYLLSLVQGASNRESLLIGAVGAGMCLSSALVIHLMGSKSAIVLLVVRVLVKLIGRR